MSTTTAQTIAEERKQRGLKLRRIRQSRGLRVSALAEQVECSANHLYNLEHGRKRPSIELLYRICRELAVPMDELATSEDHARIGAAV